MYTYVDRHSRYQQNYSPTRDCLDNDPYLTVQSPSYLSKLLKATGIPTTLPFTVTAKVNDQCAVLIASGLTENSSITRLWVHRSQILDSFASRWTEAEFNLASSPYSRESLMEAKHSRLKTTKRYLNGSFSSNSKLNHLALQVRHSHPPSRQTSTQYPEPVHPAIGTMNGNCSDGHSYGIIFRNTIHGQVLPLKSIYKSLAVRF